MASNQPNLPDAAPNGAGASSSQVKWGLRTAAVIGLVLILSACANQIDAGVSTAPDVPGFWWGMWHGFVFPWAWIGSMFDADIAVYAVPNKGGWYDFGFFLGVTVLGGGSAFGSKKNRRD